MNVAVVGAGGFLGRCVVRDLEAMGHSVSRLERRPSGGGEGVDITKPETLARVRSEPEAVVNCAARVPDRERAHSDLAELFAVNAIGAGHVAHWAAVRGARRLVQCSTLAVIARPWPVPVTEQSPPVPAGSKEIYGASKLAGEHLAGSIATTAGTSFAALRFSALYGDGMPWRGVMAAFVDGVAGGRRLKATSGAHADFLHVDDAARFVIAGVLGSASGSINAASGVETSIVDLAGLVLRGARRDTDELDIVSGPEARAVVQVKRMRDDLGVSATIGLEAGVAGLLRARGLS